MSQPIHLVIAIHGIFTGRSDTTWPEALETYLSDRPGVVVLTDHYNAGALPRLNWFIKNPRRGRSIARWVTSWNKTGRLKSVHFVAHSNGCDIARRAIKHLTDAEIQVTTAILVSAPLNRTPKSIGLADAIDNGILERVIAYVADADAVLGASPRWNRPWRYITRALRWPYGNLGRIGWLDPYQTIYSMRGIITQVIAQRVMRGWGHGDFFPRNQPERRREVFETIAKDLQLYREDEN